MMDINKKSDDEDSSYLILVTASRDGVSRYTEQIDEYHF